MKRIRISGLVRLAKGVRQELAGPISAERVAQLRRDVENAVKTVEAILREEHARLESLPAPSQRAYRFLKGVDFSSAAVHESPAGNGYPPESVKFAGLQSYFEGLLDDLAHDDRHSSMEPVYEAICTSSERIEREIGSLDLQPQQIKKQSREVRGWLAYFAQRESFDAYLAALTRARPIFLAASPWAQQPSSLILIQFRPIEGIYRVRRGPAGALIQLPTPMICFDERLWRSLAEMIFRKGRHRQTLLDATQSEPYRRIASELDLLSGVVSHTKGLHHDLAASFDRVNATYFDESMSRPRLVWSRTFTSRKFGHYDHARDTVMVSMSLDRTTVPEHAVDFIVYHELLHKRLGAIWKNNRLAAHTPQFLEMERRFRQYKEAKAVLGQIAREA